MDILDIIESISLQSIIFLFIGIICIAIAIFATSDNKKLKASGLTADGIIYALEQNSNQNKFDSYARNVNDKITVRFLTKDDVWITEQVKTNSIISFTGQYKAGEHVRVIYNPANPSEFMIESKQSEIIGRLVIGVAGLAFLIFGIYQSLNK